MYTEDELVKIVQMAVVETLRAVREVVETKDFDGAFDDITSRFSDGDIREVARTDINRTFHPGEPLFILRGQDRRALGAVRWYRDHQWPSATKEHLNNIDDAVAFFESYRKLAGTKEPD